MRAAMCRIGKNPHGQLLRRLDNLVDVRSHSLLSHLEMDRAMPAQHLGRSVRFILQIGMLVSLVSGLVLLAPRDTDAQSSDLDLPIVDMKVIADSTDCGAGWELVDQNLNEGATDDKYYLCLKRGSIEFDQDGEIVSGNPITHLYPLSSGTLIPSRDTCDPGDSRSQDVNTGGLRVRDEYLCWGHGGPFPLIDVIVSANAITPENYSKREPNKSPQDPDHAGPLLWNFGGTPLYIYTRDASQLEYTEDCGGEGEEPCTIVTEFWWTNGNFGCDRGLTEWQGECINGVGELGRYNGAMDDYSGSWTAWATGNQRNNLAMDEPINWVSHVSAHNGYNNLSDAYFLDPNQKFSYTDQLRGSVRWLSLDIVWYNNQLRLCHGDPYLLDDGLGLCSLTDRLYFNAMKEIGYWLDRHPDEVIIIDIEDRFPIDDNRPGSNDIVNNPIELYLDRIEKSPFNTGRVYKPGDCPQVIAGCVTGSEPRLPTRREMLDAGKQVIIYSSNDSDNNNHRGGVWIWPTPSNDSMAAKDVDFSSVCSEWDPKAHGWTAVGEDRTFFSQVSEDTYRGLIDNNRMRWLTECNTTHISLDMVHASAENRWTQTGVCQSPHAEEEAENEGLVPCPDPDDRMKNTIWSWDEGDFGDNGNQALFDPSKGRWVSRPHTEPHHFACAVPREGDPRDFVDPQGIYWFITTGVGAAHEGGRLCEEEFGTQELEFTVIDEDKQEKTIVVSTDIVFSAPVNGWQNGQLKAAWDQATQDPDFDASRGVWLNYSRKPQQDWAINRRPDVVGMPASGQLLEEARPVTFIADAIDPDGDPLSYSWDFGIAGTASSQSPTVTFPDDGAYQVRVSVTDGYGGHDVHEFEVTIENRPPVIDDISTNSPVTEGSTAIINVNASDPAGDYDPLTYEFDCDGDGTYEVSQLLDPVGQCDFGILEGEFKVFVRVDDGDGGEASGETTVVVPTEICVNRYNGDARYLSRGGCASTETLLILPDHGARTFCANRYNGDLRHSRTNRCASTEHMIILPDDGPLAICVNRYNGDARVARSINMCASTEFPRIIANRIAP